MRVSHPHPSPGNDLPCEPVPFRRDQTDAYERAVEFLAPHVTAGICAELGVLNAGYRTFDFVNYLRLSSRRFLPVFDVAVNPGSWLEIGCQFPALPITLAQLGFDVTVAEEFEFYPSAMLDLFDKVAAEFGIRFVDANFSAERVDLGDRFDSASLFGVIEHLPYTPRLLLENARRHLVSGGRLFLDVPNVQYAPTFVRYLRGAHVQVDIDVIYDSAIPFVGHHREYTLAELRHVLARAGFSNVDVQTFNYSAEFPLSWRIAVHPWTLLEHVLARLPRFRETIWAICQP